MKERKRCDKCFHQLPEGKRTWRPRWDWWMAGDLGKVRELVYHSDGPPLGKIIQIKKECGFNYNAYVIGERPQDGKAWPEQVLIDWFRTLKDAKEAIEDRVRSKGLWP